MNSLRKNIRCDVDGVIRNFAGSVYRVLKKNFPNITPSEQPIHNLWDMSINYPEFDKQEFYNLIFHTLAEDIYFNANPYPGTKEFLEHLYQIEGYDLILRTHQNNETALYTYRWLLSFNYSFNGFFVTKSGDKKDYMNSIIIDDKPDNLLYNHNGILMDRPWNQDSKFSRRAHNYQEVLNYVNQLI